MAKNCRRKRIPRLKSWSSNRGIGDPPPTTPSAMPIPDKKSNKGLVIGVVVGCVAAVVIACGTVVFLRQRRLLCWHRAKEALYLDESGIGGGLGHTEGGGDDREPNVIAMVPDTFSSVVPMESGAVIEVVAGGAHDPLPSHEIPKAGEETLRQPPVVCDLGQSALESSAGQGADAVQFECDHHANGGDSVDRFSS